MPNDPKSSGNHLDTGTGGFPVGDSEDRYTYDVGVADDGAARAKWNAGSINVDKTNKDLTPSTKKTLASYLSDTTLGKTPSAATQKPNSFPIDAAEVNNVALVDPTGNVVPPTETTNKSKYAGWGAVSSRSSAATQDKLNFQRGRQSVPGQSRPMDGNRLLRDATAEGAAKAAAGAPIGTSVIDGKIPAMNVTELDATNPIAAYSRSLINNRFNSDNTYDQFSTDKLNSGQFAKSYTMGQSLGPNDERDITFGRLAQVGAALSIRSGLELGSMDAGNNPNSGPSEAGALLPGWNQLGVERINTSLLTAEDVIQDLTSNGITEDNLIDPMTLSWGSLNNVLDQYAGISNFGMQLLAVALLIALSVVLGLMTVFFLLPGPHTTPTATDVLGRYAYGAYEADTAGGNYDSIGGIIKAVISGKFNFMKVIGIASTKYDHKQCLPVGALAFFGVSSPSSTSPASMAAAAGDAALSVTQSPGYYSIMARGVNRSFLLIKDAFMSIGKAFGSGLMAGVKQLLSLIDVIKNSKFIRAVNIFSQLGDRVLRDASAEDYLTTDKNSLGAGIRHLGVMDLNPNLDAAQRSRINITGAGSRISALTLAWSAHRSPDLLMIPAGVAAALNSGGTVDMPRYDHSIPVESAGVKKGIRALDSTSARIDTPLREQMEDELEAEYVPFYFHDVRTNEIVSFHAFLASLSDDFTASYDSVDAFGRVEPIKTYKGTQRKIGFSFYVVATNPNDFDTMWIKLNKLTTLVYPQFSEGRTLVDDANNNVIYAPFSQTIQASPMIRVRIGDLIRSNYSKFNLARLFGYTYPGNKISGESDSEESLGDYDYTYKRQIAVSLFTEVGNTFLTTRRLGSPTRDDSSPIPIPLPSTPEPPPNAHPLYKGLVLKVTKVDGAYVICEVAKAEKGDELELTAEEREIIKKCEKDSPDGSDWQIIEKKYRFRKSDLIPSPSTEKKIQKFLGTEKGTAYGRAVSEFMNDEAEGKGNSIVKSFRSVGGKGLAGFIESLSYDWYEKTTWEIGRGVESPGYVPGRRAPKMCKVTVAFSPIHDITPGLDHMGGNRAPVYPVGPMYTNDFRGLKKT